MSSKALNSDAEKADLTTSISHREHHDDSTQPIKAKIDPGLATAVASNVEDYENLVREAKVAQAREAQMSVGQAIRTYPKAVGWSLILSTAIVMEGYDTSLLTNFYGFPSFLAQFGVPLNDGSGANNIPSSWQSGLSNGASVGEIIGLQFAGFMSERFGYRPTIICALIGMAGFIFIPFFAKTLTVLVVGEVLQGICWGVFQTLTTAYAAEVCPPSLRPILTTYVNLCWVFGQLLASGVLRATLNMTTEWGYKIPFALQWIWPVPITIGCFLAPESPWWLVRKGRLDMAARSLRRLASREGASDEDLKRSLALMIHTNEMEKQINAGTSYIDCFKGHELRRTEIVCMTWMAQTLVGSGMIGYSSYFYEQAGMPTTAAFDLSIGQYALGVVGTVASWFAMQHLGRRTLYLWGGIGLMVLLIVCGICGCVDKTGAKWGAGSMLMIYNGFYDLTIGPVCYCLVAEIPSTRLRAKSIVLARNAYNIIGIINNIVTPKMLNTTGLNWGAKTAFFWAGIGALTNVWIYFRLPETMGRSFGELDVLFSQRVSARKFASTSVDQFEGVDVDKLREKDAGSSPGGMH